MTYDERKIADMIDRRDDAQSQIDALCGECPDVAERLAKEVARLDLEIRTLNA